ncbi:MULTISPECIES: DUF1127 domain-containing protein [unclassified Ruegeria]|uniref:DUF1127 domain-containing protein n=1 Tax=unclassified Ruegeria TaxID=2625375 RepID=UPI001489B817|nr:MULTISPECIES: DUF1127 domain-containing protein [unclassified Ruegeria]
MQNAGILTPQRGIFDGLFSDYAEAKVAQYRRRLVAKTERELSNLSDQQLNDIGVPRDQIAQRAYDSVYDPASLKR